MKTFIENGIEYKTLKIDKTLEKMSGELRDILRTHKFALNTETGELALVERKRRFLEVPMLIFAEAPRILLPETLEGALENIKHFVEYGTECSVVFRDKRVKLHKERWPVALEKITKMYNSIGES